MATLYENYITGDDTGTGAWDTTWRAQTFTPSIDHLITSVKLLLAKVGTPGIVTVSIKATDASGKPTGADLCVGTTNGNTLPANVAPYEWREIVFTSSYLLQASVKYAIVVRALSGSGANCPIWRADSTAPTYAGGSDAFSQDTGVSWTLVTANDNMFEDWGEGGGGGGGGGGSIFPTEAITRVTNLVHRYNRKEGTFTLEVNLGEVTSDFGLPQWLTKPQASTPEKAAQQQQEKIEDVVKDVVAKYGGEAPVIVPIPPGGGVSPEKYETYMETHPEQRSAYVPTGRIIVTEPVGYPYVSPAEIARYIFLTQELAAMKARRAQYAGSSEYKLFMQLLEEKNAIAAKIGPRKELYGL